MAAAVCIAAFSLIFTTFLFNSGVHGDLNASLPPAAAEFECEQLDSSECAFSVASSGFRCMLEKLVRGGCQMEEYFCRSSDVQARGVAGWIETDECLDACGLDRNTYGISPDSLLDRRFMQQLCSPECRGSCPNLAHLFDFIAAGEGDELKKLCEVESDRREMQETNISPAAAPVFGRKAGVGKPKEWLAVGAVNLDKTP